MARQRSLASRQHGRHHDPSPLDTFLFGGKNSPVAGSRARQFVQVFVEVFTSCLR